MNPRYRRVLIPGLLVALLAVVLVGAVVSQARAADDDAVPPHERAGVISDDRIPESSALVTSTSLPGAAYTINDSGHDPVVYTVKIATGRVIGTTRLKGYELVDTEALAIDRSGTLWVADIGDNDAVRKQVALYSLDQPGRGDHAVRPVRYRLRYSDGNQDAEALLANPSTGRMFVVSKGLLGGQVYLLPEDLDEDAINVMRPVEGVETPLLVTDGDVLPDGSRVLLRNYLSIYAYDARTWKPMWSAPLPRQHQGESLGVEESGATALVGTEGLPSPLVRIELPAAVRSTLLEAAEGVIDAAG